MAVSLSRRTGAVAFLAWIWDGLDRTIFTAIKFSFPARFVSPFGFLGMLTFITFVILGISGALLMFYYEPQVGGDIHRLPSESCSKSSFGSVLDGAACSDAGPAIAVPVRGSYMLP